MLKLPISSFELFMASEDSRLQYIYSANGNLMIEGTKKGKWRLQSFGYIL